jgi:flagella basal body P-ring formation protein FlgA
MKNTGRRALLASLVLAAIGFGVHEPESCHAAPGSAAPAETVVVYLHPSAVIEDPQITLGQIAAVYSADGSRAEALRALPIAPAPVRPTLLPARVIRDRLGAAGGEAVVVGGRVALLPAEGIQEGREWFYSALLSFVDAQDPCKLGRIEVELLGDPLFLETPGTVSGSQTEAGRWKGRISFEAGDSPYDSGFRSTLSFGDVPAGTMRVSYRIPAAAGSVRPPLEGSFRIWIEHFLPVARAAVDISAGQDLSEDVLTYSEEDISLLESGFLLQGEEMRGYQTLSSFRRGDRIDSRRLQRLLAIRAGDRVTIIFRRPGLQVSLPGRAFRSGSVGDIIDVRPEATAKRFQARITAKGEVLVESL